MDDDRRAAALRIGKLNLALAGGDDARFADGADMERARWIERLYPGTGDQVRAAFEFHGSAALWAVTEGGMAGVVFGASGFPGSAPPHLAAMAANPAARFVYADGSGPAAFAAAELLAGPGVTAVRASSREPEALMGMPEVKAIGSPLMLQAQLCAHFWDAVTAAGLSGRTAAVLPPGSALAWTVWAADDTAAGREFLAALSAAVGAPARMVRARQTAALLEEAGLVPVGPGIVPVRAFTPEVPARVLEGVYRLP